MEKRRKFTSELKAQIVMKIIKGESTVSEESKKYNILPGLIHKWRDTLINNIKTVFDSDKQDQIKDKKIKKYEYVISKITTQNDFLEKVLTHLESQ